MDENKDYKPFDYAHPAVPKLSDDFKKKYFVEIKGKNGAVQAKTIKVDGLIAFAHEKGLKKLITRVVQYPTQENGNTCIAACHIVGYGWDPIENRICEVEFEDFADANPNNCTKMTSASYIRMASTRAIGRALRKYTNIDVVTTEELNEVVTEPPKPPITRETLVLIQNIVNTRRITQQMFSKVMLDAYGHTNYMGLTEEEGQNLYSIFKNLNIPEQQGGQTDGQ